MSDAYINAPADQILQLNIWWSAFTNLKQSGSNAIETIAVVDTGRQ